MTDGETGKLIGGLIGLGITLAIAKKLVGDIKKTKKKKPLKEVAKDWVSKETGVWK